MFEEHIVLSREGSQQGDPPSTVELCDAIHHNLQKCEAKTKLGYMDNVKLEGQFQVVASDVQAYDSLHLSAKLSARIATFSMNIRCSRSSNK